MVSKPKFLKNTRVPEDKEAGDAVTILLEDVRHDFKAFGDDLKSIRRELTHVKTSLGRIEAEVHSIRTMLGTPEKPKVVTRAEYLQLHERLRKVEAHLKLAA